MRGHVAVLDWREGRAAQSPYIASTPRNAAPVKPESVIGAAHMCKKLAMKAASGSAGRQQTLTAAPTGGNGELPPATKVEECSTALWSVN